MNKFADFKKPSNLLFVISSSIILFYIINFLFLPRSFNPQMFYIGNFSAVIQYFSGNIDLIGLMSMGYRDIDYPPLYFVNLLLPLYVFGRNWAIMVITVHTFYLLMMLVFTYLLGKELVDEKTGLIAAILVSLYPATWLSYRLVSLEFPLIGITAMSVYFLYRSKCFSIFKWSMLFALSCVWGMWIKDVFGGFIMGPILYGFYKSIINSKKNRDIQPIFNFLAFTTTLFVAIHSYYFEGFLKLYRTSNIAAYMQIFNFRWYSFENIKPFLYNLWEAQLGILFFIVFIAGICYLFRSMKFRQRESVDSAGIDLRIMLFLCVLVSNLFVLIEPALSVFHTARYLIPQVSAVAIISAFFVRRLIDKKLGLLILIMLISFGVFRHYGIICDNEGLALQRIGYIIPDYSSFDEIKLNLLDEIKKMRMHSLNKNRFILSTVNNYFIDYRAFLWFNGIDVDEVQDIRYPAAIAYLKEPAAWFKILFRTLDETDFLIVVYDTKRPLDLCNFETVKNLFLSDPVTYKTFDWGKSSSVFKEKMSKFKLNKRCSVYPGVNLELYVKDY